MLAAMAVLRQGPHVAYVARRWTGWTLGAVGRLLPYFLKTSAYSARGNCSPSGTFIISV
jgi:hypothetical protein